jgi:hypothetical protein
MSIRGRDMPEEIGVSTDFSRKGVRVRNAVDATRCALKVQTLGQHHTKLQEYFTEIATRCDIEKDRVLIKIMKLKEKLAKWVIEKGVHNPANDNHEAILPTIGTVYSQPGQVRAHVVSESKCIKNLEDTGVGSSCVDEVIIIKLRDKFILNKLLNTLKKYEIPHTKHQEIDINDLQTLLRTMPKCGGDAVKFTKQEVGCEIIREQMVKDPLSERALPSAPS